MLSIPLEDDEDSHQMLSMLVKRWGIETIAVELQAKPCH